MQQMKNVAKANATLQVLWYEKTMFHLKKKKKNVIVKIPQPFIQKAPRHSLYR